MHRFSIKGNLVLLTLSFVFLGLSALAQEADSSSVVNSSTSDTPAEAEYAPPSENSSESSSESNVSDFRPILGISGGMLTYFGELSKKQDANSVLASNWAGSIRASFPLRSSFYFSFEAMVGVVSANERGNQVNRNFRSNITSFGFDVSYNFNHFLSEKRVVDPYLKLGFNAFLFNSKTDLIAANGSPYFYWTDGSIRDREETPENINTAQTLNRDYVYETDHRRSNVSGAGYYEKYSFAIPIGAGVNMRLTHKLHMQLGVTYSVLITDRLDGVSDQGVGDYKGDGRTDGLLYTHMGLSFDLSKRSGSIDDDYYGISDEELAKLVLGDDDYDGVSNLFDECADTPEGIEVDEKGCPFDEDKDGIPDYRDQEPGTDSLAVVDSNGVTISDEEFERIFLRFLDSTGQFAYYEDTIYTHDIALQRTTRRKTEPKQYSVQVSSDSLTTDQVDDILANNNVKSVKDGDSDALLVGEFKTIEEALAKDKELRSKGVETRAIVEETKTGKVINADINGVFVGAAAGAQFEAQGNTVFRVQVGAFKRDPADGHFQGMEVIGVRSSDGLTRYYEGNYNSYQEAQQAQAKLRAAGYGDCLIKAFDEENTGGSSIKSSGGSTGSLPPATYNGPARDKSKVRFKIQLGSYKEAIPMEDFNKFVKLGKVQSEKGLDGLTRYFIGSFTSYADAEAFKNELDEMGIPGAFIAGEYNAKTIPAQEAQDILSQ